MQCSAHMNEKHSPHSHARAVTKTGRIVSRSVRVCRATPRCTRSSLWSRLTGRGSARLSSSARSRRGRRGRTHAPRRCTCRACSRRIYLIWRLTWGLIRQLSTRLPCSASTRGNRGWHVASSRRSPRARGSRNCASGSSGGRRCSSRCGLPPSHLPQRNGGAQRQGCYQ